MGVSTLYSLLLASVASEIGSPALQSVASLSCTSVASVLDSPAFWCNALSPSCPPTTCTNAWLCAL
ncbi:hypothetical protein ACJW30_06G135700 [Castanea mollissima]